MLRSTDSTTNATICKIFLITALFLLSGLFSGDAYSSHYSKLSKKELEVKQKQRFVYYATWNPKIKIPPSTNPRTLNRSSTPIPESLRKLIGGSAIFSLMYFDGENVVYDWKKEDLTESKPIYGMSMSKSILSYLIGKAYCDGRIDSLTDSIGQYTTAFEGSFYHNVRIIDALNMASGDQKLYPNSKTGASRWKYYVLPIWSDRLTVRQAVANLGNKKPGKKKYNYTNANTDVLASLLVSVSPEGVSEFISANLAEPAGFEYESHFLADYDGVPLAHAYFMAARSDWLRAAIKISEDFHSPACIGKYLKSAAEDTVKTRQEFKYSHTRYGKFFWTNGILNKKKYPHLAMKGHGGHRGYLLTGTPTPKVILIHSVRNDYKESALIKKILK